MKSKPLFVLCYILNFILSLVFIILVVYFNTQDAVNRGNIIALIVFSSVFILVIMPFIWLCYSLDKKYKSNQQLSKKAKVAGIIFFILFSLLAIIQIIGAFDIIKDIITDPANTDTRVILFASLFLSITATSIYLCFAYWIIRKQTRKQFVDIIAQLGENEE